MGEKREEEQFNELFWNFCPHGIIAFDAHGKVANLNQSFQNHTGLDLPNLEGTAFEEFLHGFHDLESETILENLQKGQVLNEESVIDCGELHGHYPIDFYPVIEEDTFRGFFMMIHLDRPLTEKNETLLHQELIEALNHTKESVLITDAQLEPPGPKIVYVNPGFSKLTGYRKSEVLGKTPRILQGPDTDRTVIERLRKQLLKGAKFEGETFNYRKDGTPFILQWEITPLEDDNGKIKHYLAVQRDVTAKRKAEQQYQESEVRLTQYLAQAPFGIAIHNEEGIIYANQKATQLVGYDDPQQLIGADIFQFLRPDYRDIARKRALNLLEMGQDMQPMEEVLISKDGEEKSIQVTGIPCFYHGKKAIEVVIIDLSKQKAAERESQLQAEKYRKIVENAGEMMALHEPDATFTYVSPASLVETGYPSDELIGHSPFTFIHQEDQEYLSDMLQKLSQGQAVNNVRFRIRNKTGNIQWLESNFVPILTDNGEVEQIQTITSNVTHQQEMEILLEEAQEMAGIGGWRYDPENDSIWLSPKIKAILELDSEQTPSIKEIIQSHDSEYKAIARQCLEALINHGTPYDQAFKLRINGRVKWIHVKGRAYYMDERIYRIGGSVQEITEEKEAQLARDRLFNNAMELMTIIKDGKIQHINETWTRVLGWTRHELQTMDLTNIIHPDYLDKTRRKIAETEEEKVTAIFDNYLMCKDGTYKQFEAFGVKDDEQDVIYSFALDVTEEKEAQLARDRLFNNAMELMGIVKDGKLAHTNDAWTRILGWTQEELKSMNFIDIVHPDYRDQTQQMVEEAEKDEITNLFDNYLLAKNGSYKRLEGFGIKDNEKGLLYSFALDVTEEKEAQAARDNLFNNAMELMTIIDHGKLKHVNDAWVRILGWTQEELQTMELSDIVHPDYLEATQQMIEVAETDKVTGLYENYLLCKNGDYKRLEGFGIKDDEQNVIYAFALDVTEEKATKEQLQESEEKFRALSEGSTIGIYLFQDGVIQYANPQLAEITGYPVQELVGTDALLKMVHPDDHDYMLKNVKKYQTYQAKTTNHYEFRFYTANNELKHGELYSTKIQYSGKPAILGSVLDITERKEAEQELLDNKHFIEKVNENSPALILIIDFDQRQFIYENGNLEAFTGYTMEELNQREPSAFVEEMFHPDAIAAYNEFLAKDYALEDGEINQTQVRIKTKAGPYKWMRITHTPFKRDDNGHVSQVISTKQDIDDWQHLMESYKRSEQFFRQLFENSTAGLIILDADYNIQTCNSAFETIFKWKEDEIQGTSPKAFIVPEGREAESDKISQDTLKEQTNKIESIRVDKYGKAIPVLITGVPIVIDEVPVGIFHVYYDISEQKNNEKALQQQTNELLRTNEELERFAYITSHNLRAPVANLMALLDLFDSKTIKDASLRSVFQKIEASIYQMNNTVNDLVDIVSRKNQVEQPKEMVYFRELLEKAKLAFAKTIEETGAEIEGDFRAAPSLAYVKISLQNIIHELIDNALKFRVHEKRPKISLRTDPIDNFICLKVTDNGLGFDAKTDSTRPFKFYQKLHPETSGKGKGLYLVKSLVESMGGQIHVESEPYKGTSFYIYLKDKNKY